MKLCTTIGDFNYYFDGWAEQIEAMARTPFRYLDFSFYNQTQPGCFLWKDNWMDFVKVAGETANRHGLRFVQAHSPAYNYEPKGDPETQKWGMLGLLHSIEACGYLGINNIVVHACKDNSLRYPEDMEAYIALNTEFYSKLIPTMEKYQVNVLVENSSEGLMHGKCYFMSGQDIKNFVTRFNHPLLHVCWDIGHANMRGHDQYEDLKTVGSDLYALHIQDNFQKHDIHIAPYMGTVNMDSILTAVKELGTIEYFTFESTNVIARYSPNAYIPRRLPPENVSQRLTNPSTEIEIHAVSFLYDIGKYMLSAYDLYEI